MDLVFKALSGPLKGQKFRIPSGEEVVIGRSSADIPLEDPRVSASHALLHFREGRWWLIDNGSKNGIRDGQGERIEQLELSQGVVFQVGESKFEVSQIGEVEAQEEASDGPKAPAEGKPVKAEDRPEEPQPPAAPPAKKVRRWHEVLAAFLNHYMKRFVDRPQTLTPLDPALVLDFARGTQAQSKWILGFGPRQIGAASMDLPIWEKGAPDICFEIHPSKDGLVFKTQHPKIVRLNGREVDFEVLRMGDRIQIMDTLIEVDFQE